MDFWDHLEELRKVIIRSLVVITLGLTLSLFFHQELFALFTAPLKKVSSSHEQTKLLFQEIQKKRILNPQNSSISFQLFQQDGEVSYLSHGVKKQEDGSYLLPPNSFLEIEAPQKNRTLALLSPTDGITTTLRISLWVSLVGTAPIWLFFFLQFIAPGLRKKERHLLIPFFFLSLALIVTGLLFSYFFTLPLANHFLFSFNEKIGTNFWTLSHYLSYTGILMLGNALAFELLAVLFILVHMQVLSAEFLTKKRKVILVSAFVLAAILTPPDVVTQILLACPLYLSYELCILYAKWRGRNPKVNIELS